MGLLSQRGWILWETQVRGHSSLWWAFLIDIEISLRTPGEKKFCFAGPDSKEVVLVSAAHCNFVCKVLLSGGSFEGFFWIFFAGLGHFKHTGGLLLSGRVY